MATTTVRLVSEDRIYAIHISRAWILLAEAGRRDEVTDHSQPQTDRNSNP
ncbi:hypothetical protein [Nocardioides zeicaulis]|uniref:Uncharacterized protein n=1 Tax=Nocardioides zeicaulis TaxID=1776857 RepID=A0ABV6E1H6_9ACTN